jgi:uncharacterized protein YecT (DUF1311 family)
MRAFRYAGLMLVAALGSGSALAQDRDDTPTSCPDTRTQLGMNMCAHQDFLAADAELNEMWPRVVAEMRRRDSQPIADRGEQRPGYYQTMLRSQRAWLAWRDAHCVVVGYEARGGSMEPMLISQCKEGMTRERLSQLSVMLEDRD